MKQILLFLIIFRQNDCLPKIDDVHVHLNMSEIQKGVVGGNKMNPSPEFEHHGIDYDREAEGRTFTYNCGGVSTSCDNNGKCQIRCNNGRKYEVTCPNKGTITSISNSNGRSQISCGKKVKFPPCFPFCDDNSPIGPQDPNTCGVSRPCQDCNNFECNQAAAKCKWQIQRMLEAHNSGIFYAPGTCTTRMDMNQKECHMVNSEYECKFKYAAKCKWEKESPDVRWSPGTCTKRIDRNQKECDKVYNEYECNQAAKCKWETKGWFPLCKNKTIVSNQRECDKVYNEHECNKEAKCKWERMMYWSAYPGECTKTIVSNQRECNIEYNKKTECSSHGCFRKRVGKTRTVEECKNTCKEREQCGNFIWHKPGNDRWAQYDCYVLEGFKWEKLGNRDVSVKKDRNTITGTCKKGCSGAQGSDRVFQVPGCGSRVIDLKCVNGCLKIIHVHYSCDQDNSGLDNDQLAIVQRMCQNKTECQVRASRSVFGNSRCPNVDFRDMSLSVRFRCDGGHDRSQMTYNPNHNCPTPRTVPTVPDDAKSWASGIFG